MRFMGSTAVRRLAAAALAAVMSLGLSSVPVWAEGGSGKPVESVDGRKITLSWTGSGTDYEPSVWTDDVKRQARDIMAGMTDDEKIGQLFILKRPAASGSYGTQDMLARGWVDRYKPAGFVFTSDDWGKDASADGVRAYVGQFQDASGIPLIAAVDQEGGNVDRLGTGSASQLDLAKAGPDGIYDDGVAKAGVLSSYGMNLDLAPVADVSAEGSYMYGRTYGLDVEGTAASVYRAVSGLEGDGVGCCMKHFPGYGDAVDTHTGSGGGQYAAVDRTSTELLFNDVVPFMAGRAAGCSMVMVGHVVYGDASDGLSASVSPGVYRMLRDRLGDDCVAVTDSLSMKVRMADGDVDGMQSLRALQAGADLVMTKDPDRQYPIVAAAVRSGDLPMERVEESCLRVLCWKIAHGIVDADDMIYEAKTGVYSHETLVKALKEAGESGEPVVRIVVTGDFAIEKALTVPTGKLVILDLDGHTVKAYPDDGSVKDMSKIAPFPLKQGTDFSIRNGTVSGSPSKRSFVTVTAPDVRLEFVGCTVSGFDNTAAMGNDHNGAVVYSTGAGFQLDVDGCTFTDIVTEARGAIYVNGSGSRVRITDSSFRNCVAWRDGGAVAMEAGTLCVSGSTFEGCRTEPHTKISTPTAAPYGRGGAIWVSSKESAGAFVMADAWESVKDGGTAALDGAGVLVTGGTVFRNCSAGTGDGAVDTTNGHGGAVWSSCPSTVLDGTVFEDNKAAGNGGAAYVGRDDLVKNTSKPAADCGNLLLLDCEVRNCSSSNLNPEEGKENVSQTRFGGGGVFCGGNLYMAGTAVSGNVAQGSGGGVLWQDDVGKTFRMDACTITDNTAQRGEGGGLFLGCGNAANTGDARIDRGEIRGNRTLTEMDWGGGGIFVRHNTRLGMDRAIIINNRADGMGGGVAGCPTSTTEVVLSSAASLAGNTAGGANKALNVADKYELPSGLASYGSDFFCINKAAVSGGTWEKGWFADSRLAPGAGHEVDVGSPSITCTEEGWLALKSNLDPDAYIIVDEDAVVIAENYSRNNGGGIGCNGSIHVTTSDGIVPGFELPSTGGTGTDAFIWSGIGLAALAVCLLALRRKRA